MKENKPYISKIYSSILISIIWLTSCNLSYSQDNLTEPTNNFHQEINQVSAPLHGRTIIIDVSSDKLDYSYDKNEFVAIGSAELIIKEQNSKLEADKITFDQKNQIVIAENNVKITKNGNVVVGSYAKIYLDRESALINDPATYIAGVKIRSKDATMITGQLEAFNGTALIDSASTLSTSPTKISASELKEWISKQDISTEKLHNLKIKAKEIDIDSLSDRNVITLRKSTISVGKIKIATVPKMVFTTGKNIKNIETMLPEIGQNPAMGLYLGPSHVFFLPHGATFKVSPIASFSNSSDADFLGGGMMFRYMSENNQTELGYTTNRSKVMARGEQKFSETTKLVYGTNSYIENGIYGNCISKYIAEVVDKRTLASMMNFDFSLRSSAGYLQDYYSNMGTARFQLQGELTNPKPLWAYKDDLFQIRTVSQGVISVYGTGNTYGFIGAGPWISSKLGRLTLNGAYIQSAIYGDSPLLGDQYMPGKSNVIFTADVKVNKHLNIGHYGSYNLLKDNWEHKLFAQNVLYATIGPESLKFNVGYDFTRKISSVGVNFLIGQNDKTIIDFDKLKVTQPSKRL